MEFAASARPSLTLRTHGESSVNGGKFSTFSISKTMIHTRRHKPLGLRVFVRSERVPTPDQAIGLLIEEGEVFHKGENIPEDCIVNNF